MKVAIQGELGSFSHEAAGRMLPRATIFPVRVPPRYSTARRGKVQAAVVPIETSLAGSVAEHFDLLLARDVFIHGEMHLRIRHSVLVAAHQHVEHGLRADDLARRRYQRRIAGVFAHAGNLGEHFLDAVAGALLLELAFHVGNHAAGNLAVENVGFDADDLRFELGVLRADLGKVILDLAQAIFIQPRGVTGAFEHFDQGLGGIMAGAETQRGNRGIDDVGAGFDGFHEADHRDAGGRMDMNVDDRIVAARCLMPRTRS